MSKAKAATKAGAGKKKAANGYVMPSPVPAGTILTDMTRTQWKVGPSIGSGGFGEIYSACKVSKKSEEYQNVVKIEPHQNGPLFVEMHFYMRNAKLDDIESFKKSNGLKSLGMPHFIGNGSEDIEGVKHRFIVMPRYGKDLWSLFLGNGRKFPTHTIYRVAIQMLNVLEYIHNREYVHGDIKGANILLGFGKNSLSQVFLVDFGLASHYTSKEFKPDPKKMHNGTIEYTSRDAHNGVPTMRGDMEILVYNLIQWSGHQLPWEAEKLLSNPSKVQQSKEKHMSDTSTILKDVPSPIQNFTKYVATLKFDEKPDYNKSKKFFETGLKSLDEKNTGNLEFGIKNPTSAKKLKAADLDSNKKSPRRKRDSVEVDASPDVALLKKSRGAAKKKVEASNPSPPKKTRGTIELVSDSDDEVLSKKAKKTPKKNVESNDESTPKKQKGSSRKNELPLQKSRAAAKKNVESNEESEEESPPKKQGGTRKKIDESEIDSEDGSPPKKQKGVLKKIVESGEDSEEEFLPKKLRTARKKIEESEEESEEESSPPKKQRRARKKSEESDEDSQLKPQTKKQRGAPKKSEDDSPTEKGALKKKDKTEKIEKGEDDDETPAPLKRGGSSRKNGKGNDDEDTSDIEGSSPKKARFDSRKDSTVSATIPSQMESGSIKLNNKRGKSKKTYEFNFELDVSFDADVIVNLHRKKKQSFRKEKSDTEEEKENDVEAADDEEIPATPENKHSAKNLPESPKARTIPAAARAGEYKGKKAKC